MNIRTIDPKSDQEISLVASRMRLTLQEVLGKEQGDAMYSLDWLKDRVRFHIDGSRSVGQVFLSVSDHGDISGHAIVRIEREGGTHGLFSTIYVEPDFRRQGVASLLMERVEDWVRQRDATLIVYNTAVNNHSLIRLFERKNYRIVLTANDMVRLEKTLP